jgi:hypothetical protein
MPPRPGERTYRHLNASLTAELGQLKTYENYLHAARCFYHSNYAGTGSDTGAMLGLMTMYNDNKILSLAADTLCLQIFDYWRHRTSATPLRFQTMSTLLSALTSSIGDLSSATGDAVIAAVLILQARDYVQGFFAMRPFGFHHLDGAVALIQERGIENFKSSSSIQVLASVRHNAIGRLLQGVGNVVSESRLWSKTIPGVGTKECLFDPLALQVLMHQQRLDSIALRHGRTGEIETHVIASTLSGIEETEHQLRSFAAAYPSHLRPIRISDSAPISTALDRDNVYRGTYEVHYTLEMANIWCTYRYLLLRIYALVLRLRTIQQGVPHHKNAGSDRLYSRVRSEISNIIESICYSVPYFLGNRQGRRHVADFSLIEENEFPKLDAQKASELRERAQQEGGEPQPSRKQYLRQAIALSGWPLHRPLSQALALLSGQARDDMAEALVQEQRVWLSRQISRLANMFDLGPSLAAEEEVDLPSLTVRTSPTLSPTETASEH